MAVRDGGAGVDAKRVDAARNHGPREGRHTDAAGLGQGTGGEKHGGVGLSQANL